MNQFHCWQYAGEWTFIKIKEHFHFRHPDRGSLVTKTSSTCTVKSDFLYQNAPLSASHLHTHWFSRKFWNLQEFDFKSGACICPVMFSSRPLNRTRLHGRGEAPERECASLSQQCKHSCAGTVYCGLCWVCNKNTCVLWPTKTVLSCRFKILWLTLCQLHNAMEIEVV